MSESPEYYMSRTLEAIFPGRDFDGAEQHLAETPSRFVRMLKELTTPCDINWKTFRSTSDEMIVVSPIPFVSVCAHHLLPFVGVAHVGYVPRGRICGISKLARVVKHYAADLQVQEELTTEVANYINEALTFAGPGERSYDHPIGVAVVMEADHMCMSTRGVKVSGARTITSCMLGAFADHNRQARTEFLQLIGKG